jgi:radical SAM superfamily enzyme
VVLSDPGKHTNKTYNIISDRHSYGDVATVLSEVLSKEVKYNRISYEDTKKSLVAAGFPDWTVKGRLDFMKGIDSGAANQEHLGNGDFERITGEKPTSLTTWLAEVKTAFE